MAYNGFWADFLFNTGVVAAWCVFLWRVLDGPRFSWWGTALLTLVIDAAYLLPVLLLTTGGQRAAPAAVSGGGRWRWRFCSFTASRGESCSRSRRS